ncbi:MAG: phosphatase PAP2 family protein [Gemmatimonadetes bacterium]|nr:phosphatase PAP2 family protein [Gemmatimonadota bacterium]
MDPTRRAHSATGTLLRNVGRRAADGWRATPPAARRRWLLLTALGAVALLACLLLTVRLVRRAAASGALAAEPALTLRIIERSGISISSAIWFQTIGTDITLGILIILTAGIAAWNRRTFRALSILLAYVVLDLVVRVGWAVWPRERPRLVLAGAIAPGFASFPSGHTAKTLAVYGILAYFFILASRSPIERLLAPLVVLALTILTALGRLRIGAHWPSDLIGGFALGLVWLLCLIAALRLSGVDR